MLAMSDETTQYRIILCADICDIYFTSTILPLIQLPTG